jgi:hypothetical protein
MNALLSANQYIQSSGIVTVYLLLIVFAVLGILVVILTLGQKGLNGLTKCKDKLKAKREARKQSKQATPPIEDAPIAIEEGISPEVVAAIMAAVNCCMEQTAPGKKAGFIVRKIARR